MRKAKDDNISPEQRRVNEQYERHRGQWLSWNDALEYRERGKILMKSSGEITGEMRRLRMELQEKYDLLEIEATNIIRGYHLADYVHKYYLIQNRIPLRKKKSMKRYEEDEERWNIAKPLE